MTQGENVNPCSRKKTQREGKFPIQEREETQKKKRKKIPNKRVGESKKSKKLLFEPLQLWLSTHVLHFLKIMWNTLMIFVTRFFYGLNVIESKKNYIVHQFREKSPQNRSTK